MSKLLHFKCNYDPTWREEVGGPGYGSIARDFFGANKCLVVAEKIASNAHVHFQGYSDMTEAQYEAGIRALAATHFSKQEYPAARPVKRAKREVDETGFQYLCKEEREPLYQQGFTKEELQALRDASDAHTSGLKTGLREVIHAHKFKSDIEPRALYKECQMLAFRWYQEQDMMPPPSFKRNLVWNICNHPKISPAHVAHFLDYL